MSIPRRHHHNPAFWLSRWADPSNGKVCSFKWVNGRIAVSRWAPKATGYELDLYAVPSRTDEASRQEIESQHLKKIDNAAARALARIDAGGSLLERQTKDAWTTFVVSLLYRGPRGVAYMRQIVEAIEPAQLAEFEDEYRARRGPDDPPTIADVILNASPSFRDEAWAGLFTRMIRSQRIGQRLAEMHWAVVPTRRELILGDDPVLHSKGLLDEDSFIALPMGPYACFLAVNSEAHIDRFGSGNGDRGFGKGINQAEAAQAAKRVFALSPSHKQFLRKNFPKTPSRDLNRSSWNLFRPSTSSPPRAYGRGRSSSASRGTD